MNETGRADSNAPLIRLVGIAPGLALTTSFFVPSAFAAPGDLDPQFGSLGRVGPLSSLDGAIWSIEAQGDDFLFGGGHYEFYYYEAYDASGFMSRMSGAGTIDLAFSQMSLDHTQVLDIAVLPDGKVVGVGRELVDSTWRFVVFRLTPNGALDATFGANGVVRSNSNAESGASSVVADDDRVIVAGYEGSASRRLFVTGFLSNGAVDRSFGVDGTFSAPIAAGTRRLPELIRLPDGSLRVTADGGNGAAFACSVIALTRAGSIDASFGTDGRAGVMATGDEPAACSAMAVDNQSRVLVAGGIAGRGFVERLRTDGARDDGFSATTVSNVAAEATALAVDGTGSILVAGRSPEGVPGALVVRLQADGRLDMLFGSGGMTWIDIPGEDFHAPVVHDMKILRDGGVMLVGGSESSSWDQPYVAGSGAVIARLLGNENRNGPGVIGLGRTRLAATESSQQMVATVRRMGGRAGPASVGYETRVRSGTVGTATKGEDFTAVAGRIEWADGDAADKQIIVPIASNDASPEGPEFFELLLSDVQGGAMLGTNVASAEIIGDPGLAGVLSIDGGPTLSVGEVGGFVRLRLRRDFYSKGAASVTVTPAAGTASAKDVDLTPITIHWPDNANGSVEVTFRINDDDRKEPSETFTVSLGNPSTGAILGSQSTVTVTIVDDDTARSAAGGGGGGRLDWVYALLGAAAWVARRKRGTSEPAV